MKIKLNLIKVKITAEVHVISEADILSVSPVQCNSILYEGLTLRMSAPKLANCLYQLQEAEKLSYQ